MAADGPLRVVINAESVGTIVTGIGHHTANLLRGLARTESPERYYLIRGDGPHGDLPQGPRFRHLIVRPLGAVWEQTSLPTLLEEERAQVYHNPAFGLPLVKPCRFVATVHDCIPRLFPEHSPAFLKDFLDRWAPTRLGLADQLIAVSEHTKRDVMQFYGVPEERITVIHQGSDRCRRVEDQKQIASGRERWGIDGPYVLLVGRVELRKNVPGLLRAFRLLKARGLFDGSLVLAGPRDADVYDPDHLLPPVGRRGDVIVTGHVPDDDLAALYSDAAVFCFPSFYEGFGLPVLEALQCGAPVVTSGVSSLPEVAGEAAAYVDPYEVEDVAVGLERVLCDEALHTSLVTKGQERARRFDVARAARETVAVYQRVASE